MSTDAPNVVQKGYVSNVPVNVHMIKNILIGLVLGFVLSAGVVIVMYILDDTITTADDVEKYLGLNTLASIPLKEDDKSSASKYKKKRHKTPSKKGDKHHGK